MSARARCRHVNCGVYGHHWFVDPVRSLTVVALTNTALEGTMGRFTVELLRAVYDCY